MILCQLPYFNEPGYGDPKEGHRPSEDYNRNVRHDKWRWGVLYVVSSCYFFKERIDD
jgi:hypothetical protein